MILKHFPVARCGFGYDKLTTRSPINWMRMSSQLHSEIYPGGNYMFKIKNRNTRTKVWNMFKINNKVIKVNKVFIVNFEHISHLCSSVSIVNFEQVNAGWSKLKAIAGKRVILQKGTGLIQRCIWSSVEHLQ